MSQKILVADITGQNYINQVRSEDELLKDFKNYSTKMSNYKTNLHHKKDSDYETFLSDINEKNILKNNSRQILGGIYKENQYVSVPVKATHLRNISQPNPNDAELHQPRADLISGISKISIIQPSNSGQIESFNPKHIDSSLDLKDHNNTRNVRFNSRNKFTQINPNKDSCKNNFELFTDYIKENKEVKMADNQYMQKKIDRLKNSVSLKKNYLKYMEKKQDQIESFQENLINLSQNDLDYTDHVIHDKPSFAIEKSMSVNCSISSNLPQNLIHDISSLNNISRSGISQKFKKDMNQGLNGKPSVTKELNGLIKLRNQKIHYDIITNSDNNLAKKVNQICKNRRNVEQTNMESLANMSGSMTKNMHVEYSNIVSEFDTENDKANTRNYNRFMEKFGFRAQYGSKKKGIYKSQTLLHPIGKSHQSHNLNKNAILDQLKSYEKIQNELKAYEKLTTQVQSDRKDPNSKLMLNKNSKIYDSELDQKFKLPQNINTLSRKVTTDMFSGPRTPKNRDSKSVRLNFEKMNSSDFDELGFGTEMNNSIINLLSLGSVTNKSEKRITRGNSSFSNIAKANMGNQLFNKESIKHLHTPNAPQIFNKNLTNNPSINLKDKSSFDVNKNGKKNLENYNVFHINKDFS